MSPAYRARRGYGRSHGVRQWNHRGRTVEEIKAAMNWERFYRSELGPLAGHGTWRDALCPFHDDHKPSLRVNVENGVFWCPVCGDKAKGDGIKFIQVRQGLKFAEALRVLEGYT